MMNKGYMTYASDMTIMRHESFLRNMAVLLGHISLTLMRGKRNDRLQSRIVNVKDNQRKVIAEYEHQS